MGPGSRTDRRTRDPRAADSTARSLRRPPSEAAARRGACRLVSEQHDEEVLGKAYDARLMRRLLHYLRPYWRYVAAALVAILVGSVAELAQPYLFKIAIDRFIGTRQTVGLGG